MTADEFKKARATFGMSAARFAEVFGIGDERSVRRYEDASNKVSGPLAILICVAMNSEQARRFIGFTAQEAKMQGEQIPAVARKPKAAALKVRKVRKGYE